MRDEFESCTNCIHSGDSEPICILRLCKHAIAETKECYESKAKPSFPQAHENDCISRADAINALLEGRFKMNGKGRTMTDTEMERRKAICGVAGVAEIDDLSDGFHTFRQLYYQRMMLFATIVKQNKNRAWKSLRHEDGELCFGGGWFIVGVDTPEGSYTYHYEDNYYSLFDCKELERSKHWDGHTEKDVTRLLSLPSAQPEPCEDAVSREAVSSWLKQYGQDVLHGKYKFSLIYIWKNLMDLPSAQPEQRWITSGKPMNSGMYLVTLRQKFEGEEAYGVRIMRFINGNWMLPKHFPEWINEEIEQEVLAWMPLPEPWKEGEAE